MRSVGVIIFLLYYLMLVGCGKADYNGNENNGAIDFYGLQVHQSMVLYDRKAFFVTPIDDKLICDIYYIPTRSRLAEISMPYAGYPLPHANVSCIGNVFYSSQSVLPLLYVSSWNNQRQAFVYDIFSFNGKFGSNLIQIIDPSCVSKDIIGGGYLDWVVDPDGGYLYSLAYHLANTSNVSEGNFTHVTKFVLPSLSQKIVVLQDNDVLEHFTLPVMLFFQDKCYEDGHIYVAAGMPDELGQFPPCVYDIDLQNRYLKEHAIPLMGEPEGLCIYDGTKWLNMCGSSLLYNIDRLVYFGNNTDD